MMSSPFPIRSLLLSLCGLGIAFAATGCSDDESSDPAEGEAEITFDETITWHQHVAPLVHEKCGGCHNDNGIGPFSISTYEEARMWAPKMERDIQSGAMPPWAAQETEECTPPGTFKDDLRLSDREKALFSQWIKDGRLEGDADTAAEMPEPPELELNDATRELTLPGSVTVSGTTDEFICFVLDPQVEEEVWLTGTQVVAGNEEIAHHALVYLDRDNESADLADENGQYPCFGGPRTSNPTLLAAWAPGSVPTLTPENTGMPLQAGDKIVVQMHYHPTGVGEETDEGTRVDLRWTTEEPEYLANIFLIGNFEESNREWQGGEGFGLTTGPEFRIPAGEAEHVEESRFLLPDGGEVENRFLPITLWGVATHMHYVGTDMKITLTDAAGEDQCLIQTPSWDFNWQRAYFFDGEVKDMPHFNLGDILNFRCTYDNSLGNPFVRDALEEQGLEEPVDVTMGDESLDEMCLGVFAVAVPAEYKEAIGL